MSEDKLSREILLRALDDMFNGQPLPEYATIEKRAYEQIKSILTPIPEDELDGFVEKWVLKFPVACAADYKLNQKNTKAILKAYDELKEKKNEWKR